LRIFYDLNTKSTEAKILKIIVLSFDYFTENNIHVGSSKQDVMKAYPDSQPWFIDNFKGESDFYNDYFFENYHSLSIDGILFILKEEIVVAIEI